MLSNAYFMRVVQWYVSQGGEATMREGDVILTPLPLFHMNALCCSLTGAIVLGGALVPLDRFHARRWWRSVADSHATIVHYLGVMPAILLKLPPDDAERGHRIRFAFGAGVDPRHQEAFEARFGFPLVEGWAMTETGAGAVTTTALGPRRPGQRCIGRFVASTEYRIADDDGADVAVGEPGELLVRTRGDDPRAGFFTEYLNDPAATAEAWAGGWFHSGDVVRADTEGLLYFVDRKKNIVRRSGENIAVIEVEGVLETLDGVAGVAVAPVTDELRGEEVCAIVRLRDGIPQGAEAARSPRRSRANAPRVLPITRCPVISPFVEEIPVTATQKLQRAETRAIAARLVAEGGAIDLRDFKTALRHANEPVTAR